MITDSFTTDEKLREIEREIAIRERFYPDWVATGRIAAARAQKQIDILQAIARDYRVKAEQERLL